MRKNAAMSGAASAITPARARPSIHADVTAVRTCALVRSRRCTSAAPTPRSERMADNQMIVPAAATTPNSAGDSSRARIATTGSLMSARTPVPETSQTTPPTARHLSWCVGMASLPGTESGAGGVALTGSDGV